jgi:hypothetical protein
VETKRQPNAIQAWQDIQAAAHTETLVVQRYIAGYAEIIGYPNEAMVIYRRLLRFDGKGPARSRRLNRLERLDCYTRLLRIGAGSMSMDELSQMLAQFVSEFPEIDEGQNDNAYIHLLQGVDLDKSLATTKMLLLKRPELLSYRTTAALALLCAVKPQDALAIYQDWVTDWNTAPDRSKAVYAAVLKANGKSEEAEKIIRTIHAEALRAEERQLAGLPNP